jgi:[Skp1-protein]-hydroxyproline N-acetylglucosaminyltransferase
MIGILSVALDSDGSPGPGSGSKRALRLSSPLHGRSDRDYIPPAGSQWPTTIRNEVFERINHPANESIQWTVPKFWSRPIHEQILMDRHRAMQIGTCSVADALGSVLRGADCPTHQRTIFVAIASYRDFQCRETIESIYSRASFPDRIRVGVVDQIVAGVDTACNQPIRPCNEDANQALCRYQHLIDVITIHAKESVGPVPARHVGHRMYRGEYYAAQVDAHLGFASRWDTSLILELESTGNEMAVLSTYLSDVSGAMDEDGNVLKTGRPIMCNCYWKESLQHFHIHHSVQPEGPPAIRGSPQLHPWWSAGFSFSRGHFVVNVPYDLYQPMVFSGEEMSIALRGWSMGYDFYSPEKSVCFHYYQENEANIKKRGSVPTFWENADGFQGSGVAGMRRMLGIVHMLPEDDSSDWDHRQVETYGLGGVRKPEQLMEILGIHVTERTMESHVCKFVNPGTMHKMFTPKLRPDGMGIDYSGVDYHWLDPDGNEVRMDRKVGDSQAEAADDEDDANNEDDGENGAAPE